MSKKILIVDDRPFRRQNLLNEVWNNISSLDNVEHMTCMPSEEVVESFDIIAIHRSYVMSNEYYDYLTNLVKRHDKYIVLFSWKRPVCVTPEAQVPLTLESKFRMTPIKS